jgi:hypothetical protein
MRKDELLHLHQLLACVKQEYERRGDDEFPAYEDIETLPVAAFASKGGHKRAALALAADLADQSTTGTADAPDGDRPSPVSS